MKLRTSTAVIALLAGSVALGACGQEDAESDTVDAARANPQGYGNYAPRGPAAAVAVPMDSWARTDSVARVAVQPSYSRGHSVDGGQNFPYSEQTQTQRRSAQDPGKVSRFE